MAPLRIGLLGLEPGMGKAFDRECYHDPDVETITLDQKDNARLSEGDLTLTAVLCRMVEPWLTDPEELDAWIRTCANRRVPFMPAFPLRCAPAAITAKAAVDCGDIGDILAVKACIYSAADAVHTPNPILIPTLHMVDMISWLTGAMPREVYTLEAVDAAFVHVKFDGGAAAVIDIGCPKTRPFHSEDKIQLELTGATGVISVDFHAEKNEFYGARLPTVQWKQYGDNPMRCMVEQFVEAVRNECALPASGKDIFPAVAAAWAACESSRRGKPLRVKWRKTVQEGQNRHD